MKKQFLTVSLGLLTIGSFAQKKELKAAEKLLKGNDFTGVLSKIKSLDGSIENADEKYKAQYYFLKGQALAGQKNYTDAATSFNQLLDFEKKIGKNRYGSKAAPMLNNIVKEVSEKAIDLYNNKKDFKGAAENFYLTYVLSPKDTAFAYNAAISATQGKDYDGAIKYYRELQTIGYTGIETQYLATNKSSGKVENLGSKSQQKLMVKSGQYIKPETKFSKSKQADIAKSIALILKEQGKKEEAITAISEARKSNPKDADLILAAANIYYSLNRMDKYGELIKEATNLLPNDSQLFYNLGVVSANQGKISDAINNYKKAIELNPNYYDANLNMAAVILDKNKSIVEEINNNLSNAKKYDELINQQKAVYLEALPYLEKADSLKQGLATVETLKNVYEALNMKVKAAEYLKLYKSLK